MLCSSTSRKLTVRVFLSGRIRSRASSRYFSSPSTVNLGQSRWEGRGHRGREGAQREGRGHRGREGTEGGRVHRGREGHTGKGGGTEGGGGGGTRERGRDHRGRTQTV